MPQIVTPHYCNFSVDLRDTAALDAAIERAGLDPTAMTYILSECVMVYMEPRDSSALIAWLAKRFSNAVLVVYEQVWGRGGRVGRVVCGYIGVEGAAGAAGCCENNVALSASCPNAFLAHYGALQIKPDDAFGRQMCSNLESRGCPLLGLHATPTLEAHVQRMVSNGWSTASCHDMDTIYKRLVGVCNGSRGWEGA